MSNPDRCRESSSKIKMTQMRPIYQILFIIQEMLSTGHFGKSKAEAIQIHLSNDYCHNIKMGAIINIVLMLDYNSSARSLE